MAMSGLKLTMAASSIHPHKLFRHVTTSSHSPSPSFPRTSSKPTSSLSLFPSPNITTTTPTWWRITTPCAHLSLAAHVSPPLRDKTLPSTPPLLKCFSSSSTPPPPAHSHSHAHKSGFSGSDTDRSSPSGSGLVADMDSEDSKAVNGDWYCNRPPPPPPGMQPQQSSSKLLTLPTILTIGRVAAVPILICTFYVDSWWGRTATTSIFIAAAITDWLDGYIARKMRLSSVFGAFLDPVADKLMVAATLVLLCTKPLETSMFGQAPWLLTVPAIAIIGREITMSAVREWAASQNPKLLEAVAVNNLGKWKTASQMIALTILLATRDSSIAGPGVLVASGVALLYMSAGLSLWSLVVYMGKIWKVLLK